MSIPLNKLPYIKKPYFCCRKDFGVKENFDYHQKICHKSNQFKNKVNCEGIENESKAMLTNNKTSNVEPFLENEDIDFQKSLASKNLEFHENMKPDNPVDLEECLEPFVTL